ncbi:ASCH domain-containing protein [Cohnella sp. OV330]|uniref:ASCH domain-containing protein n=1 Tax=Cohnella sp. OV330 TaxID=1855288 RepID=UPI0008EDB174|nr:ASCH domain-containing protein [Cohnella sp. OV330]SFA90796.1 ASCH domain-containing protein [Cohnella sp. OV330]
MKGLIIKPYWADLILAGQKTWEIRGSYTHHRGPTAIIKSGSGKVYGVVNIVDCMSLPFSSWSKNKSKHHVPFGRITYERPHAWVLQDARMLPEPLPYVHPQGAVIWSIYRMTSSKEDPYAKQRADAPAPRQPI